MKLIKCIIPNPKLEAAKAALLNAGVQGVTFYEVKGFGIHRVQLEQKLNKNYTVELLPQTMLEIVLTDEMAETIIQVLMAVTRTGHLGDGKIFLLPVEDAVRLRTGERGDKVL